MFDENQGLESKAHRFLNQTVRLEDLLFEGRPGIRDVHQDGDAYVSGRVEHS